VLGLGWSTCPTRTMPAAREQLWFSARK